MTELARTTNPLLSDFRDVHLGQDLIIIGSGPSLSGYDLKKLSHFKDQIIAVNHAYKDVDSAYMIFGDQGFFWREAELTQKKAELINRTMFAYNKSRVQPAQNIVLFGRAAKPQRNIYNGLYFVGLSGTAALSLAIGMGATRIFLLGFDCKTSNGLCHYSDSKHGHRMRGDNSQSSGIYRSKVGFFKEFAPFKSLIYNVCPDSAIPYFKKISFQEFEKNVNLE